MTKVGSKKVIAVVVTYNRKDLLRECLEALLSQDYDNCEILVVDNASTDGTKDYIKDFLKNKKIHYANTGKNIGGAGGFNYGIKEAYKIGCDYIWLMDDDSIVRKNSLKELMTADKTLGGDYGFLTSKILWTDGKPCVMNRPKKTFSSWLKDYDAKLTKVAMASFVSLFLKAETVKEFGLPIKEFFIWTDDWEYTRRISRKKACYFVGDSVVTHKCKQNIGASIANVPDDRVERFKYMYRNDVYLYRREGIKGALLFRIRLLIHEMRLKKSSLPDKRVRAQMMKDAIKSGKDFNPEIEYVEGEKNVAEFFGEPFNYGGQEAFALNMYSAIDQKRFNFTFITPFGCENSIIKEKTKLNGDKIIHDDNPFESKLRKKFIVQTANKHLNSSFDVVHIHSGSTFTLLNVAKIAKKKGIKKVIVHSHSVSDGGIKYRIIKTISDIKIGKYADIFFACSKAAGVARFPKRIIASKKFYIIKNGIKLSDYKFSKSKRDEYRKEFGLSDKHIIVNVGRFSVEKNQLFILEVLKNLLRVDEKSFLILVGGDGEMLPDIEKRIEKLDLKKRVLILRNRDDIKNILDMSDIFVLPSTREGFPFVAIEAQANGLPCIFSDTITHEANVSEAFHTAKVNDTQDWEEKISMLISKGRINTQKSLEINGFSISQMKETIEDIYG